MRVFEVRCTPRSTQAHANFRPRGTILTFTFLTLAVGSLTTDLLR
jgi:hypothetical protein